MLRQYHAQRRQSGDNPRGVGTVALGSIFYLQDDGYWRARFGRTAVCRTPWSVESFLNGQYHAARRDPATGHWLSVYAANRTDLALVRSLRDGRRRTVAIRLLQRHEDEGSGRPDNRYPALPSLSRLQRRHAA
ncbi:Hypothetical protein HVPorG_03923a (plasmid) [Roseomonas mucosa]|uniref:hypothetical protein n=1 Tax=Roseomonas mucosa TaxID=207340 RepID=UPI00220E8366|nr:hypothetical protein [Roseomonas mucosa]QDJ12036.1 Hypothetical protein HVPorG_03923a [Roseomonas mucosa]